MTAGIRSGWFWEMQDGRRPPPPAIRTLGGTLTSIDPEAGEVEATFTAGEGFLNSMGIVQGGFLAAMLDAALGSALACTLPPGEFAPTLELKINYLRPVRPGLVTGRGRVVHRGERVAFLAGELRDPAGELTTTATATSRVVRLEER
jgi:uncharacterized protein (TIGR00369 family)